MPSCYDSDIKVDFVVPSRDEANPTLMQQLKHMPCAGQIINTHEKPLSIARKNGVLQAKTEWVAMVDDDMLLPDNWLQLVTKAIEPKVGAIGTVAVHKNKHVAAYERVVGTVYNLSKLDTNPHINNIIVRRKLMENYNPAKVVFWGGPILQALRTKNRLCMEGFTIFRCYTFRNLKKLCRDRHIL